MMGSGLNMHVRRRLEALLACVVTVILVGAVSMSTPLEAMALEGGYIADSKGNHLVDGAEIDINDVRCVTLAVYGSSWAFTENIDYFAKTAGLSVVCNETGQDMIMDHTPGFLYPVDREGNLGCDYRLYPMVPGYTYTFTVYYGVFLENDSNTDKIFWSESLTVSKSAGKPDGNDDSDETENDETDKDDNNDKNNDGDKDGDGGGGDGDADKGSGDGDGNGGNGDGGGDNGSGDDSSNDKGGSSSDTGDTGLNNGGTQDPDASDDHQSSASESDAQRALTENGSNVSLVSGEGDGSDNARMSSPNTSFDSAADGANPSESDRNASSEQGEGAAAGGTPTSLDKLGTVFGLTKAQRGSEGLDPVDTAASMVATITGFPWALLILVILFVGSPLCGAARRFGWFRYGLVRRSRLG